MWGRGPSENKAAGSALCRLSVTSSTSHSKLGPSGSDARVGGLVYFLGPFGSLQ